MNLNIRSRLPRILRLTIVERDAASDLIDFRFFCEFAGRGQILFAMPVSGG